MGTLIGQVKLLTNKATHVIYRTIKMKSVDVQLGTYFEYGNSNQCSYKKYENTKIFFQGATIQIGLRKSL